MADPDFMRRLAEDQLRTYANWADQRDEIIRFAYRAGVSKNKIMRISGIARTTIDRVLNPASTAAQSVDGVADQVADESGQHPAEHR